jgi:hypothetical protein
VFFEPAEVERELTVRLGPPTPAGNEFDKRRDERSPDLEGQ